MQKNRQNLAKLVRNGTSQDLLKCRALSLTPCVSEMITSVGPTKFNGKHCFCLANTQYPKVPTPPRALNSADSPPPSKTNVKAVNHLRVSDEQSTRQHLIKANLSKKKFLEQSN